MVDQKTTFITKLICGHGVCGSFVENNRNAAVFSLMGNVAVSNEKKMVNRKITFVNIMVDAVRKTYSKTIHFSKFKNFRPVSKVAGNIIRNVYL